MFSTGAFQPNPGWPSAITATLCADRTTRRSGISPAASPDSTNESYHECGFPLLSGVFAGRGLTQWPSSSPERLPQAHDVADHLRDSLVVLRGNFLVDLGCRM